MKTSLFACVAAALLVAAGPAVCGPDAGVAGQKLDSGLGSLPHYANWLDRSGRHPVGQKVVGESLDDGLGQLPHYSTWKDRSGRDPMGRNLLQVSSAQR